MNIKPNVLVLKTDGINRDEEMAYAFKLADGKPKIVHINELRTKNYKLTNYNILAIPGGFSYGDDIVSGKILAIELTSFFADELKKFVERKDTATIGVCNGFQILVRTGLLPFGTIGKMQATLTNNDSGHFECRWVNLGVEKNSRCVFLQGLSTTSTTGTTGITGITGKTKTRDTRGTFDTRDTLYPIVSYPVAHGEGKFFTDDKTLQAIEESNLVAFRYVDERGNPTQLYPQNPNGALNAIGGICDLTGRVLGLMPHPECFVRTEQHPNWRREKIEKPHGLPLFENIVNFVKQS